jgi:hypothetical protein
MSVKVCMLAYLLKLQQFWRQKEDGQLFEWFVDTTQKTESMYISNFELVYFAIYKYFLFFSTYILFITLCSITIVHKVFHFAHLISWHSHYSRME